MKEIRIAFSDDEYLNLLKRKGDKTHKTVYMDGLGLDYTPPKQGRPRAFDIEEIEKKAKQEYLRKIREYNQLHADDFARARANLGLDLKEGERVIPPLARRKE